MYSPDNVEFMGVLVKRYQAPNQSYAQLVFKTAEGLRLSLSRNIDMVYTLRLGGTYRVKGPERIVGQKRYIHEPAATLLAPAKAPLLSKRYKILIPAVAILVVAAGGVGVFAYTSQETSATSQPVTQKTTSSTGSEVTTASPSTSPQPASATPPAASSEQQTATPSKPTASKRMTSSSTATRTPAAATSNPVTSAANSSATTIIDTPSSNDAPAELVDSAPANTLPVDETPPLEPPVEPSGSDPTTP